MLGVYTGTFVFSLITLLIFIMISDRKVMFYNASFFIFVFIANLGYLCTGLSKNIEEALMANRVIYICGPLLSVILMMMVFDACRLNVSKLVRLLMYGFNITVMLLAMTVGHTTWFYKDAHIEKVGNATVIVKEYGPAHALFLVMLYGYMLVGILILIYSLMKKHKIVLRNVVLMLFMYGVTILVYAFGRKVIPGVDPMSVAYCFDAMLLLIVTYNTGLYNLDEVMLASVEKQGTNGYILFDRKYNYLGCNDVAVKTIPEIENQKLFSKLDVTNSALLEKISQIVAEYNGGQSSESFSADGIDLEISVQYIYKVNKVKGYIVRLADDSRRQGYIRKLDMISNNKSNFLSNVSHEIRTPINSVIGMNEMILRECKDEKILEYASNIASSGQTLLQLINDVLDLSKIESGKLEVIPVEYCITDIIHDLENMISPLVKDKSLELTIKVDPKLPKCLKGDSIRVKQMATNILTNAVKYTEKGSIELSVCGNQDEDGFKLKISVSDTGKGIKEKDIDNLFNAFEQFDQVKNLGIEGTGLGLAITKKFANMMGGDIVVTSEYSKGSVFSIVIPQEVLGEELVGDYGDDTRKNTRVEYKESFRAPDAKVLVVDDVKMNLAVIKNLLKKTQVKVVEAGSGQAGIDAVKDDLFDIILLDHMMPGMDGVETLNIIREEHLCDETPIIVLTANVDVTAKEKYKELGFDGYLPKPVNPHELEKCIKDFIPETKILVGD